MSNYVPERIKSAIDNFVIHHREPGWFVMAVLQNDLAGAFNQADPECLECMAAIVHFVYWEVPGNCWGSPAKVAAWLDLATDPYGRHAASVAQLHKQAEAIL